jgi:hypothetical protein
VNENTLIIFKCSNLSALFLLIFATMVSAETLPVDEVKVVGNAEIIQSDHNVARQNAIADALKQAEESIGVHLDYSAPLVQFGEDSGSQIVRTTHSLSNYRVVKEWESENFYHVELMVKGLTKPAAISGVKKKILFLQFEANNSLQLDDIRNPYSELPKWLAYRLEARGGVISSYINGILPKESDALRREAAVKLAKETGAQFIVAGMIEEAGIVNEGFRFFSVRHFRLRITLYDGITGATLTSFVSNESANGRLEIGDDKSFGGGAFLATESGNAINRLANLVVTRIESAIECLPFSTRIVRVDKDLIYLDAGATSRLEVGDKLTVFSVDTHFPLATLGVAEEPIASINLVVIQPLFSTASLDQKYKEVEIKAGNIARIELSQNSSGNLSCLK